MKTQKSIISFKPGNSLQKRTFEYSTFFSTGISNAGVIGVYVDTKRNEIWAALSDCFCSTSKFVSVAKVNRITGESQFFNVTSVLNPESQNFLNDVVVLDDGTAFIANSLNGQILKISIDQQVSLFVNNSQFLYGPDGKSIGFDGIEYADGNLLVGIYQPYSAGGGLVRFNLQNSSDFKMVEFPDENQPIEMVDGMRFNSNRQKLYMVNAPNYLVIAESSDHWATARVIERIDLRQKKGFYPPANSVAFIPESGAVYVLCANQYGSGPYSIIRAA